MSVLNNSYKTFCNIKAIDAISGSILQLEQRYKQTDISKQTNYNEVRIIQRRYLNEVKIALCCSGLCFSDIILSSLNEE